MRKREYVDQIIAELSKVGVVPGVELTKRGHWRVRWSINGNQRQIMCGSHTSCRETNLNNITQVRRMLRADGIEVR